MKTINYLPKIGAILLFIITIASCDEDFNSIGGDIIGDPGLLSKLDESFTVISYSRKNAPVQTNSVPISQLGIYNDNTFGKSTANYITQLLMSTTNPIFADELGQEVVLDSVILYMPYFQETTIDDDGTTYELDSVYGDSPVTISMYESNFYLRDSDPESDFEEDQFYYSNQGELFEGFLGENIMTLEDFVPSNESYLLTVTTIVDDEAGNPVEEIDSTYVTPGIRRELPLEFFQEKILDKEGEPELNNNNNFKNYFRGLYFKVTSGNNNGNLFKFNPSIATITMYYHFDREEEDENGDMVITVVNSEYELKFGGVNLNTYENELSPEIEAALSNPNTEEGEENLYVRGGDGILTVINLFGDDVDDNGVSDELEVLREKEWIINDATLKFYVNQSKIEGGATEPERITIYNLTNNTVLVDYVIDPTSGNVPVDAFTDHLGRLERDSDENGVSYRINITSHVSSLINKDSTNVPLGLIVSQNVLVSGFQELDTLQTPNPNLPTIKTVPTNSVFAHEGTVLYGNNTINEDKKLKLQIYYIEPN